MKLYTDSELIHSQEIILSTSDIITSTGSEELKRRNFMLLSAFSLAMMMYPTKSEAFWWMLARVFVRPFIRFAVKTGTRRPVTVSSGVVASTRLAKAEVSVSKKFLKGKNKKKKAEKVQTELSIETELPISPKGVSQVLEHMNNTSSNETVWDQTGIAENTRGEVFMNQLEIKIRNKTDHYIERKVRLILLNEYDNEEFSKQFTLKAGAKDTGIFNLNEYFRKLPKTGVKRIAYDVLGGFNDVEITSSSSNVLVTKLIG